MNRKNRFLASLLLPFAPAAPAWSAAAGADGAPQSSAEEVLANVLPTGSLGRVLVDQPGDGNVWALADGYKARFGADGVDFIPYFGAAAPRNFPVRFRLESVTLGSSVLASEAAIVPAIEGTRVTYERGALAETWELRTGEVEQRFVLPERSGAGDLVVRLAVESELAFVGDGGGLLFEAPGFGFVRYGHATILDSAGRAIERPTEFADGRIEIRVPGSFVAEAEFPLTVDPVVFPVTIAASADEDSDGDVAYDASTDRWLVVWQRTFSASDADILARRWTDPDAVPATAPVLLDVVSVDATNNDSRAPSVANHDGSNQFLVAWRDVPSLLSSFNVRGRLRSAGSTTQGAVFDVAADPGDQLNPDVGGTSGAGGSFVVAYLETPPSTADTDVLARTVSSTGVVGPLIQVDVDSQDAVTLAICKSGGDGSAPFWVVAYQEQFKINLALLDAAGVLQGSTPADPGTLTVNFDPDVAGDGTTFFAVWERASTGGNNIAGARFTRSNSTLSPLSAVVNLTQLEPGTILSADQKDPAVAYDGCRFSYAYLESFGVAGAYDAYAATVFGDSTFAWHEAHVPLNTVLGTVPRENASIAARAGSGGVGGRYFAAWTVDGSTNGKDVQGVIWHGTAPTGGVTVADTGCGGPFEQEITCTSPPAIGSAFSVAVGQVGTTVVAVGGPIAPITLCPLQGNGTGGCKLGVNPILLFIPGGSFATTIPPDSNLLGATLAFQGFSLNIPEIFGGGCSPPLPIPILATNTLTVTVQ